MRLDKRTKYTPTMIEKWVKGLDDGTIDKEGIIAKAGIGRSELNRRLREYREMNTHIRLED